jgi:uncharacterized protein (TIGR03000 family)
MVGTLRPLRLVVLSGLALLLLAGPCLAQRWRWRGAVVRRPIAYNRAGLIGPWWTWPQYENRIDRNPYYGRYGLVGPWWTWPQYQNVYSPYAGPYAYPYGGYPVPPVYPSTPPVSDAVLQAAAGEPSSGLPLPRPTGPIASVPSNAALIKLLVPDEFGQVWFDGVQTTSIGTTRYYITPPLPGSQPFRYEVRATFKRNGESVSEDRVVSVTPGQTTVVDFTRAQAAQATGG